MKLFGLQSAMRTVGSLVLAAVLPCSSAFLLNPRASFARPHLPTSTTLHIFAVESWYDSGVRLSPAEPAIAPTAKPVEAAEVASVSADTSAINPIAVGAGLIVAAGAAYFILNGPGGETVVAPAVAPAVAPSVVSKPIAVAEPPATPPTRPPAEAMKPADPQLTKEEKLARAKAAAAAAKAEYEREIVEFKPRKS